MCLPFKNAYFLVYYFLQSLKKPLNLYGACLILFCIFLVFSIVMIGANYPVVSLSYYFTTKTFVLQTYSNTVTPVPNRFQTSGPFVDKLEFGKLMYGSLICQPNGIEVHFMGKNLGIIADSTSANYRSIQFTHLHMELRKFRFTSGRCKLKSKITFGLMCL